MNLVSLLKAARNSQALDLAGLMKAMGLRLEASELAPAELETAFQDAAWKTRRPGAVVLRLRGVMPDGSEVDMLAVTIPAQVTGQVTKDSKKLLDAPADLTIA